MYEDDQNWRFVKAKYIWQGNGMPGVPGLFIEEQKAGWRKIADAIHAQGGFAYMQLWYVTQP